MTTVCNPEAVMSKYNVRDRMNYVFAAGVYDEGTGCGFAYGSAVGEGYANGNGEAHGNLEPLEFIMERVHL